MPALFAYLIALGLLLGGGYGALTWLAAPEPVKVVAKAKPTPRPHFDEANGETASEPSGQQAEQKPQNASPETISQSDQFAVGSNQPPVAPPAEASTASTEQGAQAEAQPETSLSAQTQASAPAQVQQDTAANAKVSSAEIGPPPDQPPPAQTPAASTAAAAAAKTVKPTRPHQQRLASRSEKPALALMTLRTIEFPDGHRVTQLLPYRDGDRD